MESIISDKPNAKKSTINIKNLTKKMDMLSFDEEAIYKSKDWPQLWLKTSSPKTVQRAFATDAESAERKVRNRRFTKIFLWGIASLLMYLVLFINQGIVTEYFTRGGYFTIAIVATAIVFALVHGTFAGHVLEKLNYKAVNRNRSEH